MMNVKSYFIIFCKGFAMGCCDLVPGVSGSTIALITGIYERLIDSIAAFNLHALKTLLHQGIKAAWREVNAGFLLALVAGIVSAVLLASRLIQYLFESNALLMWSFFFGLILASIWIMFRQVSHWNLSRCLLALLSAALTAYISLLPEAQHAGASFSLFYIFICGALAIIALILPGISGSFILLLLGAYAYMLNALREWQYAVIAVFILGIITGVLCFSRILKWFLSHYRDATLAVLTGVIVGALCKVFPWQYAGDAQAAGALYGLPILVIVFSGIFIIALERVANRESD